MTAVACVLFASACGPWHTTIPTYWDPELTVRSKLEQIMPEEPPLYSYEKRKRPERAKIKACSAIYVVTVQNKIWAYRPDDNRFSMHGPLTCEVGHFKHPFSMAINREGFAHVEYTDGRLYNVDLDDLSCRRTSFIPNQAPGFWHFGMGYAADDDGGESLYVAEISHHTPSKGLAKIDTRTGDLHYIGPFSENPGNDIELTPTGDGPLFGYFLNEHGPGGTLVEIDKNTADIVRSLRTDVGTASSALAVAWWGGKFYVFTTSRRVRGSLVHRIDFESGEVDLVAQLDQRIVGAGVSTCAPGVSGNRRVAPGRKRSPRRVLPAPTRRGTPDWH